MDHLLYFWKFLSSCKYTNHSSLQLIQKPHNKLHFSKLQ
uniref:Uncharacterized protein n=1 Tax=Anguilla anguilla TaxID=7936 RepID=A0A0E9WCF5_ANGAN